MPPDVPNFIIVDDSRLDCFITEKIIRNVSGQENSVLSFSEAAEALRFVENSAAPQTDIRTVILLDIQMPVMTGFDFVEAFENLPGEIRSSYSVYMVSSSTNESDRIRIGNYPSIRHLYKKPLNRDVIIDLIAQVGQ